MNKKLTRLPKIIKVKIVKTKESKYIAELPEYDIFTEADNPFELDYYINDLIYTFFDVPRKYQGKIIYCKVKEKKQDVIKFNVPVAFKVFCAPNFDANYHFRL